MQIELRDYQHQLKQRLYQTVRNLAGSIKSRRSRIMLQLPTGGGKSAIIGTIVLDKLLNDATVIDKQRGAGEKQKKPAKVMLVAHKAELIYQLKEMLIHKCGFKPFQVGVLKGADTSNTMAQILICSIQTLNNRLDGYEKMNFELIIIDEAHHALAESYLGVMRAFPNATFFGLTATPYRLNGRGFTRYFDALVCGLSIGELIKEGWLSPPRHIVEYVPDLSQVRIKKTGDYNEEDLFKAMRRVPYVDAYTRHAAGRRGVGFFVSIEHATEAAIAFKAIGVKAEVLSSKTPADQRERIINEFKKGTIRILCNVDIVSEGFDLPDMDFVLICRPTQSLSLHLQQVGRVLRTATIKGFNTMTAQERVHAIAASDKPFGLIIDLAGNIFSHGDLYTPYDWEKYYNGCSKSDTLRLKYDYYYRAMKFIKGTGQQLTRFPPPPERPQDVYDDFDARINAILRGNGNPYSALYWLEEYLKKNSMTINAATFGLIKARYYQLSIPGKKPQTKAIWLTHMEGQFKQAGLLK